jgi:hypothetical protein
MHVFKSLVIKLLSYPLDVRYMMSNWNSLYRMTSISLSYFNEFDTLWLCTVCSINPGQDRLIFACFMIAIESKPVLPSPQQLRWNKLRSITTDNSNPLVKVHGLVTYPSNACSRYSATLEKNTRLSIWKHSRRRQKFDFALTQGQDDHPRMLIKQSALNVTYLFDGVCLERRIIVWSGRNPAMLATPWIGTQPH